MTMDYGREVKKAKYFKNKVIEKEQEIAELKASEIESSHTIKKLCEFYEKRIDSFKYCLNRILKHDTTALLDEEGYICKFFYYDDIKDIIDESSEYDNKIVIENTEIN